MMLRRNIFLPGRKRLLVLPKRRGVEIIDLIRNKANRREFEGRIKKLSPNLVFLNGHGSGDSITGHNNEVLIKAEENHYLLEGKITYALSCDSGKILGPKVASNNSTAYIGYADEFIFVCDKKYLTKPLEDPLAKPFMESSNQVMISLLEEHTAEEASERSKAIFRNHYIKLSSSNTD